MSAEPFDEDDLPLIIDSYYEPIGVAFDVEYDSITADNAGVSITVWFEFDPPRCAWLDGRGGRPHTHSNSHPYFRPSTV